MSMLTSVAAASLERIHTLSDTLQAKTTDADDDQSAEIVLNALGRFNVWGKNMGAFQDANSRSSLDWRLRKSPYMAERIRRILSEVDETVERAQAIHESNISNRDFRDLLPLLQRLDPNDAEDAELIQLFGTPTTEFDELVKSLEPLIDRLFRLAAFIRQGRFTHSSKKLEAATNTEDDPARISHLVYLRDKYKKLEPWLRDRLGDGFSQRRAFILKRQTRPLMQQESGGAVDSSDGQHSFQATTYYEELDDDGQRAWADSTSLYSQATSFTSACIEGDEGKVQFPDLEKMEFHGHMLQYNELFQCPFCRDWQIVQSLKEWRKHLLLDLMPYMCTFKDCFSQLFLTRHEWFRHELECHRKAWQCRLCGCEVPNRALLVEHIRQQHPQSAHDKQGGIMQHVGRPGKLYTAKSCPFCDDWVVPDDESERASNFRRHVGRHLQQVALEAIPIHTEGLVVFEATEPVKPDEDEPDAEAEVVESEGEAAVEETRDASDHPGETVAQEPPQDEPDVSAKVAEPAGKASAKDERNTSEDQHGKAAEEPQKNPAEKLDTRPDREPLKETRDSSDPRRGRRAAQKRREDLMEELETQPSETTTRDVSPEQHRSWQRPWERPRQPDPTEIGFAGHPMVYCCSCRVPYPFLPGVFDCCYSCNHDFCRNCPGWL